MAQGYPVGFMPTAALSLLVSSALATTPNWLSYHSITKLLNMKLK